jgi:hypothetical protein
MPDMVRALRREYDLAYQNDKEARLTDIDIEARRFSKEVLLITFPSRG